MGHAAFGQCLQVVAAFEQGDNPAAGMSAGKLAQFAGQPGKVLGIEHQVGLRVTRIRDGDGVVWYVRNGEIIRVANRSQGWSTATVDTTVGYTENTERVIAVIEAAAQGVLDARALFPDATLADLYDPLTMPPALVEAHQTLDRAVDAAYGKRTFKSDAERVAFLFERYQQLTSLLPVAPKKSARKRKTVADDTDN